MLDPWQRYVLDRALGERPDGKWAAREAAVWVPRQNGKGAIIEARVLAGLFLFQERRILWSAHEYRTAQEGFLRIRELIESCPDFDRLVKRYWEGSGEQGVELTTGQRLKFLARSRGAGRGFSGDCIILDEAQELTLLQMKAIFSTMSAKSISGNPQIWYLGTPPEDSAAWVYGIRKDGEDGSKPRLAYFDWGMGDVSPHLPLKERLKRYADRDLWYQANPGLGIRISEEFCEDELSRLAEGFAPERLGMWLPYTGGEESQWQVIAENAWLARLDAQAVMGDPITLAVDVTPDRTWAAIAAAGPRIAGGRVVDVIDHRPGTGWVVGRLVELAVKHGPLVIVCSDKALADKAEGAELPGGGELAVIRAGAADMAAAAGSLYDAVAGTAPDLWHLGQASLTTAAAGATKRTIGDGWGWNRRSIATDICPLVAVSLAVWALGTARLHNTQSQTPFALT